MIHSGFRMRPDALSADGSLAPATAAPSKVLIQRTPTVAGDYQDGAQTIDLGHDDTQSLATLATGI